MQISGENNGTIQLSATPIVARKDGGRRSLSKVHGIENGDR